MLKRRIALKHFNVLQGDLINPFMLLGMQDFQGEEPVTAGVESLIDHGNAQIKLRVVDQLDQVGGSLLCVMHEDLVMMLMVPVLFFHAGFFLLDLIFLVIHNNRTTFFPRYGMIFSL